MNFYYYFLCVCVCLFLSYALLYFTYIAVFDHLKENNIQLKCEYSWNASLDYIWLKNSNDCMLCQWSGMKKMTILHNNDRWMKTNEIQIEIFCFKPMNKNEMYDILDRMFSFIDALSCLEFELVKCVHQTNQWLKPCVSRWYSVANMCCFTTVCFVVFSIYLSSRIS
jgi:hypothetical protein